MSCQMFFTHTHKRYKETFGGAEYFYYLERGDSFMGVCICPNSSNYIHKVCAGFCVSTVPQLIYDSF